MVFCGGYNSCAFRGTAELLGLYIVVVAGTRVLPQWLRFKEEEVDACGADALVDCCPHWCWDLLRLVYSSVRVVLGWRVSVTLNRWSEDRTQMLNPPTFLCLGNISQVAEL